MDAISDDEWQYDALHHVSVPLPPNLDPQF